MVNELPMVLLAQEGGGFLAGAKSFLEFVPQHWQFCLLHFLEFAIWGAWFVVLGNFLNARGFSRKDIGRIYSTIPIGSIISPLFIGFVADKYVNTEVLIGVSHLVGAVLLFVLARVRDPRQFFWITLLYALAFAPTLSLVNSIVFAHDADIFGGAANEGFPWIRVFGTFGWIAAGLSHAVILKKGEPVSERPLLLAGVLSVMLGLFAFTLPETRPAAATKADAVAAANVAAAADVTADAEGTVDAASAETAQPNESAPQHEAVEDVGILAGATTMLTKYPVFFGVSFVTAMAMGLYFAFAALYLEQSGVRADVVGPVMTIGQWIEIFFMLTLPWFLGPENVRINQVLLVGVGAWALRFGLFAIGKPLPMLLLGVAIHGICFDFFFAAGMINTARIAPAELTATAQQVYGFLVYGLGMYLGSELSGWLNQLFTRQETTPSGETVSVTNWRSFWIIPCVIITIGAILFGITTMSG